MAAPARRPRALLALGLALLAAAAAAADPFSPQLGDTGGCRGQCGRSLQRRAAADAVLNACYRGCRLFSICHFVDASAELNTTRAECEAACAEAYGNAEEQFGCVTGCRKQLPEVEESRKEKSLELEAPSFSVLDLVSTFCNDIVSSAQSFISSTWTFYLQADDGKVVVFQSQPEMEYPAREALEIQPAQLGSGSGSGSSPGVPQPHTGAGGGPPGKGGQAPREGGAGQSQGAARGAPAAGARLPRLHVQALGPSSLDPGRLPLPLHHGDAVAQLCQPGDRPRAARQDPASEHQRGQGIPGGPGWPRHVPAAARHRRHPVPRARRGGRGAAAPQSRPGQDHPVALPPLPTAPAPSPRHRPRSRRAAPRPQLPEGHLRLLSGHCRSAGGSRSRAAPLPPPGMRREPGSWLAEPRGELPARGGRREPFPGAGLSVSSRPEPPGPRSPPGTAPALGRREPAAVGDGECLQPSELWLGTSPASHLGLSLRGAGPGPGNSLPPAGADCLEEPKRGEWIWPWQPGTAADPAASVPTQAPGQPLPGAAEGPCDGSFPSLLRVALGELAPGPTNCWWHQAGDEAAFP